VSDLEDKCARELVQRMMQTTAQVCLRANEVPGAKRLMLTNVDPAARFACAFRSVRIVEQALQIGWALEVVGKAGTAPAGRAIEALQLTRVAMTAYLNRNDLDFMDVLAERVRMLGDDSRNA